MLRSIGAAENAAEKQRYRAARAMLQQQKEAVRAYQSYQAWQAVEMYQAYETRLRTVHTRGSPAWNWQAIASTPPPQQPTYFGAREHAAQSVLAGYKPGIGDRLRGSGEARRRELAGEVERARHHDQLDYQAAMQQFRAAHDQWRWHQELAAGILTNELDAFRAALEYLFPAASIPEINSLNMASADTWYLEASAAVDGEDDLVPMEAPNQLRSGELSMRRIARADRLALYEDYVCSCALRIAWEVLALVPVSFVFVHMETSLLNRATGHLEMEPILSVAVSRETLMRLNPHALGPAAAMTNFTHAMKSSPKGGMKAVKRLLPADFAPARQLPRLPR